VTVRILTGDCRDRLAEMPEGSIDLTVTSPPYDDLRSYGGYSFEFEPIARELHRVTKPGGVVVWVVGDATVEGSETGTSFRQALYFRDACGFNLHDTMIYRKFGTGACGSRYGYWQAFEFMFVLSRGVPKTINLLCDRPNGRVGATVTRGRVAADGSVRDTRVRRTPEFSIRQNVWDFQPDNRGEDRAGHPAVFPKTLARDHILSWSNPGDTVLDPFLGSGTTAMVADRLGRHCVGVEINPAYADEARRRIEGDAGMFASVAAE
jgi:DNA modification methylase